MRSRPNKIAHNSYWRRKVKVRGLSETCFSEVSSFKVSKNNGNTRKRWKYAKTMQNDVDCLKHVLVKFQANASLVRRLNGRSKFRKKMEFPSNSRQTYRKESKTLAASLPAKLLHAPSLCVLDLT